MRENAAQHLPTSVQITPILSKNESGIVSAKISFEIGLTL